jgi:hypothetical protein
MVFSCLQCLILLLVVTTFRNYNQRISYLRTLISRNQIILKEVVDVSKKYGVFLPSSLGYIPTDILDFGTLYSAGG